RLDRRAPRAVSLRRATFQEQGEACGRGGDRHASQDLAPLHPATSVHLRRNAPHAADRPVVTATLKLCVKSSVMSFAGSAMYAGIGNTWPTTDEPTGVPSVGRTALKGHSCGLVFDVLERAVSCAPHATASSPAVPTTFGAI